MENKKPGCLSTLAVVVIAVTIIVFIGGIGKPEVPDVEGMTVSKAKPVLKEAGFENIEIQSENDAEVTDLKTWTVTAQKPPAGGKADENKRILLTCQSPETAKEEEAENKLEKKLDASSAWVAVQQYGESEYPYGFDLHLLDVMAEEVSDKDTWYLKTSCDVANQYGAEKAMTCEAHVTGTSENPTVVDFIVY